MIVGVVTVKDYLVMTRGGYKKAIRASLKEAWYEAGIYFHTHLRDKRFTKEHAKKAGYTPRKGEASAGVANYYGNSKAFMKSYTGRKLKKFGHTRPLEFSGTARRLVRTASISSTSNGSRVRYPGARVFNYKNPFSNPAMNLNLEFRTILPEEAEQIGRDMNDRIDSKFVFDESQRSFVTIKP